MDEMKTSKEKELDYRKRRALKAAETCGHWVKRHDKHTTAITLSEYYGEEYNDNAVWDMVKESPELDRYSVISDPNNSNNKWAPIAYIRYNIVTDIREYILANS